MTNIQIKRIYEPFSKADGYRILIDRLWPRGIKKEAATIDQWMKEVAPSTELRKWFNHDYEKWGTFQHKYIAELKQQDAVNALAEIIQDYQTVTLLYAARDEQYNNAIVLKQYLEK